MIENQVQQWQRQVISGEFGSRFNAGAAADALLKLRESIRLLRVVLSQPECDKTGGAIEEWPLHRVLEEIRKFLETGKVPDRIDGDESSI
jgi:hypothetical protein